MTARPNQPRSAGLCSSLVLTLALSSSACGESSSPATPGPGGASSCNGAGGSSGASGAAGAAGQSGSPRRGTGTFERIVLHSEFYSEGSAVGDFDRDGVLDVVAGPYWYAGPAFSARHALYPAVAFDPKGYSDNFFNWVVDLNADGWPDVLVVGFPGQQAAWYENPKDSCSPWPRHLVHEGVANESPAFVDLNADGRAELVFAHGGRLGYAEPAADPSAPWIFRAITADTGAVPFTHGLGVGDVDGDGRLDVIDAGGWWQQPSSLEADPLWPRQQPPFVPGGAQMFAYDVDGDGDNDVITSREAHGYGISWFEQTSLGFDEHVIAPADPNSSQGPILHEPHALGLADMNSDGLMDVIGGERFWGHVPAGTPNFADPAALYWFELTRSATGAEFVPHLVDDASGVGTQVTPTDANGDGVPDIVVANKKGAFVFLQRTQAAP